ncbi:MAG: pinensin family lanthipeptide [Cyclobacteriaceae bacterium]
MKKMKLNELKLSSFVTGMKTETTMTAKGGKKTDLQDTNCSAVDRCASARGCTIIDC